MLMRDDSTVFHHVPQRSEARRVKKAYCLRRVLLWMTSMTEQKKLRTRHSNTERIMRRVMM
jgi:hypothetical protein